MPPRPRQVRRGRGAQLLDALRQLRRETQDDARRNAQRATLARDVLHDRADRARLLTWIRDGGLSVADEEVIQEWLEEAALDGVGPLCPRAAWPALLEALGAGQRRAGAWEAALRAWLERGSRAWHEEDEATRVGAGEEAAALAQMAGPRLAQLVLDDVATKRHEWQRIQWASQMVRVLPQPLLGLDTAWPEWVAWTMAEHAGEREALMRWRQELADAAHGVNEQGRPDLVAHLRDTIASLAALPDHQRRIERALRGRTDWTPDAALTLVRCPDDRADAFFSLAGVSAPPEEALREVLKKMRHTVRNSDVAALMRFGRTREGDLLPMVAHEVSHWISTLAWRELEPLDRHQTPTLRIALSHPSVVADLARPRLVELLQRLGAESRRVLVGTLARLRPAPEGDPAPPLVTPGAQAAQEPTESTAPSATAAPPARRRRETAGGEASERQAGPGARGRGRRGP